ncbi:MAG: hypothetical protein CFE44_00900 [Burkholderiales bacterium PBB4]|nr:MAG: hypothetical protein CFE44_00900 [Burkholderiales bacterium PBB4]
MQSSTFTTPTPQGNSAQDALTALGQWGVGLFAAACGAWPLAAHADVPPENATLSFKYLDYQDSQPGNDRIRVKAPAFAISTPFAGDWSLDASYVFDAISGASPGFYTAPRSLSEITEQRRAVDASVTRYWADGSLKIGAAVSNESDYESRAVSALGSWSSAERNTTWKLGVGVTKDRIRSNIDPSLDESRTTVDGLLGVTQVLTPNDIAQLTVTFANGQGFFSDPYKALDSRPRSRQAQTLLGRWNHFFTQTDGTARLSYRYYTDTNQIKAHTLGLEYEQPLPGGWALTPLLRVYSQSAASFYVDPDPQFPNRVNIPDDYDPGTSLISFDQRTSAYGARTLGFKLSKQLDKDWAADLKLERYEQRGEWRIGGEGSPNLAPFIARTVQLGLTRRF